MLSTNTRKASAQRSNGETCRDVTQGTGSTGDGDGFLPAHGFAQSSPTHGVGNDCGEHSLGSLAPTQGDPARTTTSASPLIRVVPSFTADTIRDVVDGAPLLAVVDAQILSTVAKAMADQLMSNAWGSYSAAIGAGHIGTLKDFNSLFECFEDTACTDYFDRAPHCMPALSRSLFPYANPARWLVDHLNAGWPAGAEVLTIGGRPCYVGLPRSFAKGGAAELHTDRADWDLPSVETSQIKAQLAFNFCLSQTSDPDSGSLALWSGVPDKGQYNRHRRKDVPYALDETFYGKPDVVFRPLPGQLYLFNAFRPHAVRAASGTGTRVTISGFIDYYGEGTPLRLHS